MKLAICTIPRSGLHMILNLLEQSGLTTGFWPDTDKDVVGIHSAQAHLVKDRSMPKVWLCRRDVLGQAISWYTSLENGGWTHRGDSVPFNREEIQKGLSRIELDNYMWGGWTAHAGGKVKQVFYEDLVEEPRKTVARLLKALGIEAKVPQKLAATTEVIASQMNEDMRRKWESGAESDPPPPVVVEPEAVAESAQGFDRDDVETE